MRSCCTRGEVGSATRAATARQCQTSSSMRCRTLNLLVDLGLTVNRKKGMLGELSEPYGPEDWAGLVGEWVVVHKKTA